MISDGSKIHRRRSIRLPHHDYSQPGGYFVTICADGLKCLFGEVVDGSVRLSKYGNIVRDEWLRTPQIRREIQVDAFVVMPNHFHGIVFIEDDGANPVGAHRRAPTNRGACHAPLRRKPKSIGSIIAGFKSAVTRRINEARALPGAPVWQRNYYEHVIRNESDLNGIRDYIASNPARWHEDENNLGRL